MTDALRPGLGIDALAVAITSELLPTARLLQDASTTPFWLDSPVARELRRADGGCAPDVIPYKRYPL